MNSPALRKIWKKRKYYFKLMWIHPEWLRQIVSLLIALPLFIVIVVGASVVILLVPLIIAVKYLGITFGFIIWAGVYMYIFYRINRWSKLQKKYRPRRRVKMWSRLLTPS